MHSNENAHPTVQVEQALNVETDNESTANHTARVELALLAGLMMLPARRVLEIAARVDERDFYDGHHRTIYAHICAAAHEMESRSEADAIVHPTVVQLRLQGTGELSHGNTASALIQATTGAHVPPSWSGVLELADGLKVQRLRRAMRTAGAGLVESAEGSADDMARALHDAGFLPSLALRAGLEVTA
ncbi:MULTISPECIES: DnaB-like helicase N-terminal domain-containing protein [Corynebacterium]|uniref:DnaB-like helicase N-terminal domain-containing protein n=1 Tax=Corynebacterium TaxID=1716 RepID=UPI0018D20B7D|nr:MULTISPECIES: DnaB-like helicase N-terminal domain-containing protein [Corynebacterium]